MADNKMSIADKQYMAKILYAREQLDAKIVAKKVGISERTMGEWVKKFGWKNLRRRLLISKEEQLNNLYEQLEELNTSIKNKQEGKRHADTKEADIQIKLTASIRNLETELNLSDTIEAGMRFIKHLQRISIDIKDVMNITDLWHDFIQASIKK